MCWLAEIVNIHVTQTSSFKSELAMADAQQRDPGTMSSFGTCIASLFPRDIGHTTPSASAHLLLLVFAGGA